jgi:hypothetical protein
MNTDSTAKKFDWAGLLYRYHVKSIATVDVSAEEKQQALVCAIERLAGRPLKKQPQLPRFRRERFTCGSIRRPPLPIPISWTWINRDRLSPGPDNAPSPDDQSPDNHLYWDDDLGVGQIISGDPGVGPELSWVAQAYLPAIIPGLDAYRADVEPVKLADHDRATPDGLAGWQHYRWKIYGVSAACFYDDRICRSAFGIDAARVADRVKNEVPYVQVLQLRDRQGVLMQTVERFVDVPELLPVRARVMAAIRGERRGA